ncbi:MAG: AraC family transcriptional regulator [Lentisphaeria bacterium]|nr:AraC family transcriptional regulator [Lentisphaeria bacterium]
MKTAIPLVRRIRARRPFYDEETILSGSGADSHSMPLDIFCFGHSLFRRGAEIHIVRQDWIVQFQLSGKARIITRDEKILMEPGCLLISPPGVPYTYKVPPTNDMTKYYLIFRTSPLLEMLLGREIRRHGMKIRFQQPSAVRALLEEIGTLFEKQGSSSQEQLSIRLYELVCRIRSAVRMTSPEGGFFRKLEKSVNDLMNQQITLERLSASFGVGKFTLIREFKKHTGMPPVAYMIRIRRKYARQLLLMSDMTVAEIAACCGYSSASFFISDFRKHCGITPGQFRARNDGKAPPDAAEKE